MYDVAYIWHAHMLSPIKYMQDIQRLAPTANILQYAMPLQRLHEMYENGKTPDAMSVEYWEKHTQLPYTLASLDDSSYLTRCPWCTTKFTVAWPTIIALRGQVLPAAPATCPACHAPWDRDVVSGHRFWSDIQAYLYGSKHIPLAGALVDPGTSTLRPELAHQDLSQLFQGLSEAKIRRLISDWKACQWCFITRAFDEVQQRLAKTTAKEKVRPTIVAQMFAAYREIVTPTSLDLCGAALRQRTLIHAMKTVHWSYPVSLLKSMRYYRRFIGLVILHPDSSLVPTLNVDLVWQTHLMHPQVYSDYTVHTHSRYVDHDNWHPEEMVGMQFMATAAHWHQQYRSPFTLKDLQKQCQRPWRIAASVACLPFGVYNFRKYFHLESIMRRLALLNPNKPSVKGPSPIPVNVWDCRYLGASVSRIPPDWVDLDAGYGYSIADAHQSSQYPGWGRLPINSTHSMSLSSEYRVKLEEMQLGVEPH
ncbi:hypothetical protein H4R35_001800 [Dimargaris xerosporica]|nr:hypothetical protein H4R35_001800 [Dimargaris xerosporica]